MVDIPDNAAENNRPLKLIYGFLFIASVVLGVTLKFYFRKYIFIHQINDFGITGFLPSFLYVLGFVFFYFSMTHMVNGKISHKTIIAITLGALTYEIIPLSSGRTFDLKDMIATVSGALIAYYCYYILEKRTQIKEQV